MMEGYQSEKENKQTFIGWQEDETIESFTKKIVESKKKKMLILLGNKCDFDYDSAREVSENVVERFVDKYQDLGMVQSEVSVL